MYEFETCYIIDSFLQMYIFTTLHVFGQRVFTCPMSQDVFAGDVSLVQLCKQGGAGMVGCQMYVFSAVETIFACQCASMQPNRDLFVGHMTVD